MVVAGQMLVNDLVTVFFLSVTLALSLFELSKLGMRRRIVDHQ
jgi:hypothetical protein